MYHENDDDDDDDDDNDDDGDALMHSITVPEQIMLDRLNQTILQWCCFTVFFFFPSQSQLVKDLVHQYGHRDYG